MQFLSRDKPPPSEIEPKPLCVSFATLPYSVMTGAAYVFFGRRSASSSFVSRSCRFRSTADLRSRAHRGGAGITSEQPTPDAIASQKRPQAKRQYLIAILPAGEQPDHLTIHAVHG